MPKKALRYLYFPLFIMMLCLVSCGKKKSGDKEVPTVSTAIPADWDLNSDYSKADLKVKELNP